MLKSTVSSRLFFWVPTTYNWLRNKKIVNTYCFNYIQESKFFDCKILNIFLSINLNLSFGCSKESSHRDGSFEYPQHMFWLRNKKIVNIFLPISLDICFGFSKDRSHRNGSFEYPQYMFRLRNEKILNIFQPIGLNRNLNFLLWICHLFHQWSEKCIFHEWQSHIHSKYWISSLYSFDELFYQTRTNYEGILQYYIMNIWFNNHHWKKILNSSMFWVNKLSQNRP